MAKSKKGQLPVGCPNFNELLRICAALGKPCDADNPMACELRPDKSMLTDSKPKVKSKPADSASVEKKPKNDLPARPKFFTIEEQLRELGVTPTATEKALDNSGTEAEVVKIEMREPGEPAPAYVPKCVVVKVSENPNDDIEFAELTFPCLQCRQNRWWRYNGFKHVTDWICDWCHPSPITPNRTICIDKGLKSAPRAKFTSSDYFPKTAPEDF